MSPNIALSGPQTMSGGSGSSSGHTSQMTAAMAVEDG